MRAKWTGGLAQAVKHLLCKYKVLNSNPKFHQKMTKNPAKKQKELLK
jgi:hypothetical protein